MAKTALVISGGGSRGAFAVGAIKEMFKQGLSFDLVSGTSTGALIAPLVATGEIDLLEEIYATAETDKIIKRAGGLNMTAVYKTDGLKKLIDTHLTSERYEKILASNTQVFLATVVLETGEIVHWNPQTSGRDGRPLTLEKFKAAMFASASIPVLMPTVEIAKNNYVDGGVRECAPLSIAVDEGAETIYAIILSPEGSKRTKLEGEGITRLVEVALKTIDVFTQDVVYNDINTAVLYNKIVRYNKPLREKAKAILTDKQFKDLFEDPDNPDPFKDKKVLDIFLFRPDKELPADALEFVPSKMKAMIKLGEEVAKRQLDKGPQKPSIEEFERMLEEMRKEFG
jgi:NTE family protein